MVNRKFTAWEGSLEPELKCSYTPGYPHLQQPVKLRYRVELNCQDAWNCG